MINPKKFYKHTIVKKLKILFGVEIKLNMFKFYILKRVFPNFITNAQKTVNR